MYWRMIESRSDNDYGQSDSGADEPFFKKIKSANSPRLFFVCMGILLAVVLALGFFQRHHSTPTPPIHPPKPTGTAPHSSVPAPTGTTHAIAILLDDFSPQPYQGESVYFFNRLGGDRGAVNNSILDWGNGQVTTTISPGNSWGGVWMSLNHPIREELSINFSAILPPQVLPAYQSQITGITAVIIDGTPGRTFKLELKDGGELQWKKEIVLNGPATTHRHPHCASGGAPVPRSDAALRPAPLGKAFPRCAPGISIMMAPRKD